MPFGSMVETFSESFTNNQYFFEPSQTFSVLSISRKKSSSASREWKKELNRQLLLSSTCFIFLLHTSVVGKIGKRPRSERTKKKKKKKTECLKFQNYKKISFIHLNTYLEANLGNRIIQCLVILLLSIRRFDESIDFSRLAQHLHDHRHSHRHV